MTVSTTVTTSLIQRQLSNARMSQIVKHGGTVYLAGQVDANAESEAVPVEAQTQLILARIEALLLLAGTDKHHLLSAQIWLADMADFATVNAIWEDWLPADAAPARATCGVQLARSTMKVEITVVAALPAENL